jgi:cytoskeletal protein CcmA (bactofilin family)
MFKRRTKSPKMRGGIGAFLDEGTEIEGKYSCAGTVMLNGRFQGEIHAKDTLIIGASGSVHADIMAGNLIVHGEIVGNVTAAGRVELKVGARITGDIEAPVIVMEEGVILQGQCRMSKARQADVSAPASNLVALPR